MSMHGLFRARPVVLLPGFFVLALASSAFASQWPLNGTPVCTAPNSNQYDPQVVADGAGGAFVVWLDYRAPGAHIYLQRLSAAGQPLWAADGIAVCPSSNSQYYTPQAVTDDAGGVIVVWGDQRSGSAIYAQRVGPDGNLMWDAAGILVCNAAGSETSPQAVADGAGGTCITWIDERDANMDIYAQRIDAGGNLLWGATGVAACSQAAVQDGPEIAADALGAYIVWKDLRSGNYDLYATRISPSGAPSWAVNGSLVCNAANTQEQPQIIPNGFGGAIIVWRDLRGGSSGDIYLQLLNAAGSAQFAANGLVASTTVADKRNPQVVPSGSTAGALVVWEQYGNGWDIYAQRMQSSTRLWGAGGVVVCSVPYNEETPQIITDGSGGAIIAWTDSRLSWEYDVYAQKLDANGAPLWTANGVACCVVPNHQTFPQLVADGSGGAIVAWRDYRSYFEWDIYAQRIDRWGNWGYASPDIARVSDVPGDQGGQVNVEWDASRLDPWPDEAINEYSVWRAISPATAARLLESGLPSWSTGSQESAPAPNAIRVDLAGSAAQYWQLVGKVDAYHLDSYAFAAPTLFDSTATSPQAHSFQVIAHKTLGSQYWISAPAEGRSIDNLAPAAPLALIALRTGNDVQLTWRRSKETDVGDYAVYRATASGVTPTPIHFLASSLDTMTIDADAPSSVLYYVVTARDIHDNQGAPSNEAMVPAIPTGVGNTPALTMLRVQPNAPNPFSASTAFSVGLPKDADVVLEVFDVAGRRVRSERGRMKGGWQEVRFDAVDNTGRQLPSGVYFFRVTASGSTVTRKMVIAR